ncbi:ABC transporter permease [Solirubrobacter sp. CPCC 204708]|uniref:Transport permease protein n=1 Tax=Solirubrobacter deserti TaxID=2282478 RepID=A0ABT4RP51_9ACTN|nr:ABC transporter permease [Solirubrobacter deserti]MBE2318416.1 ABC transporter permease [Solirubrobacter deserti]MDA0140065.1 ABC transporter permease [Solirubrobacter deserti]
MTEIRQSWQVSLRYFRVLARQPAFLLITIVQPLIWLLLFGALFKAVTQIPGFGGSGDYLDYLTPGIVVMLAVSSAGWTGMGFIEDINSGVMDRMLVTPAWRGAFNVGSVAQCVVSVLLQTLLIIGLALLMGAEVAHAGALLLVAALLAASFASLSNGLGVLTRQRESLIGAVSLLLLPLTFLSSALMQLSLAPGWIETVARFNPVDWAAVAARDPEPLRIGLLAALTVLSAWFATRAFAVYQRSL